MHLPFLTASDRRENDDEGKLDPLGFAVLGDRLADEILPGMRARMWRPRFLTAMAASGAVCEGFHEQIATDGRTPAPIAFEWLYVGGLRALARDETRRVPGILKARTAWDDARQISARSYLQSPGVFGLHGIYKPLAISLRVVDEELQLGEAGHELLRVWEREQRLPGVSTGHPAEAAGSRTRSLLRQGLVAALEKGATDRSGGWRGWDFFRNHLAPGSLGQREADTLFRLLTGDEQPLRAEVFRLLSRRKLPGDMAESAISREHLMKHASPELASRLDAIDRYEDVCTELEFAFNLLRYLSSRAGARAIGVDELRNDKDVRGAASGLRAAVKRARQALEVCAPDVRDAFEEIAADFGGVTDAGELYRALLDRHRRVQQKKPPDGKREWFEQGQDGKVFVRVIYRLDELPVRGAWNRPYRILAARSFCEDLRVGAYGR
jgi:hypothetical protein